MGEANRRGTYEERVKLAKEIAGHNKLLLDMEQREREKLRKARIAERQERRTRQDKLMEAADRCLSEYGPEKVMKVGYDNEFELTVDDGGHNSTIRQNLLKQKGYTPYCGSMACVIMPRTTFNGKQFVCSCCGWESRFPEDFIEEYKATWEIE